MTAEDDQDVAPRWRDHREMPDAWLLRRTRRLRRWFPPGVRRRIAGYALRYVHCMRDGACYLRAGHRGGCDWGE